MSYISHLYSIYFAPRGNERMAELGMQIAQQYLRPMDKLIGIIGDAGSGKSMLVKGMFPGLELTNDDEGVNVRPLPILEMLDLDNLFSRNHNACNQIMQLAVFYCVFDICCNLVLIP